MRPQRDGLHPTHLSTYTMYPEDALVFDRREGISREVFRARSLYAEAAMAGPLILMAYEFAMAAGEKGIKDWANGKRRKYVLQIDIRERFSLLDSPEKAEALEDYLTSTDEGPSTDELSDYAFAENWGWGPGLSLQLGRYGKSGKLPSRRFP